MFVSLLFAFTCSGSFSTVVLSSFVAFMVYSPDEQQTQTNCNQNQTHNNQLRHKNQITNRWTPSIFLYLCSAHLAPRSGSSSVKHLFWNLALCDTLGRSQVGECPAVLNRLLGRGQLDPLLDHVHHPAQYHTDPLSTESRQSRRAETGWSAVTSVAFSAQRLCPSCQTRPSASL